MSQDSERSVAIERVGLHQFRATNVRGGTLTVGEGGDADFSPVELLLVAIAGCTALDVEYITGKRSDPAEFSARARADKVRDEVGNHLTGIEVSFNIRATTPGPSCHQPSSDHTTGCAQFRAPSRWAHPSDSAPAERAAFSPAGKDLSGGRTAQQRYEDRRADLCTRC
ncbi:MAG TPA: OsmC family protein [Jatrophihabitans sp.]|nr:OsmC family protein [Jatrophihabitans sp.]